MEVQRGQVVRSLAGHDKGGFLAVVQVAPPFAFVCDGKRRPLERPKRKKAIHTAPAGETRHPCLDVSQAGGQLSDRAIRRALAAFRAESRRV